MIPFLLLLAVGVGQQPSKTLCTFEPNPICVESPSAQPAPLKCEKYKHLENVCSTSTGTCSDKCVDDLHPLKESEYQEMAQHIRDLERNLKAVVCGNMNYQGILSLDSGKTTTDCATLKPDMRRCKDLGNGLCFVENQPSPER